MSSVPEAPSAATLKSRHLLGIAGLEAGEITLILDTAVAMKEIGRRAIKNARCAEHGRNSSSSETRTRNSLRLREAVSADR